MTLRDLLIQCPRRFYPQTWYRDEPFLDTEVPDLLPPGPLTVVTHPAHDPPVGAVLPFAAVLAGLYIRHPESPLWSRYLWCADTDAQGQRIYVGSNGKGLEIHRHLHLTDRWGVPIW